MYNYYSTILSFHHTRSRERAKYEAVIHCSVPLERGGGGMEWVNTTQLAKYPHALYAKPSNKVYVHTRKIKNRVK